MGESLVLPRLQGFDLPAMPRLALGLEQRELDAINRRLERMIEGLERSERLVRGGLEEMVDRAKSLEPSESAGDSLEKAIEKLGVHTSDLSEKVRRNHLPREREIARARALSVKEPAFGVYASLLQRFVDSLSKVLEAYEAARTELIVVLSEMEPGHGPTFDDPEELRSHLESILAS